MTEEQVAPVKEEEEVTTTLPTGILLDSLILFTLNHNCFCDHICIQIDDTRGSCLDTFD